MIGENSMIFWKRCKKQYKKDFTMDTNYERTKRGTNPE